MSNKLINTGFVVLARIKRLLRRTGITIRTTIDRRDGKALLGGVSVGYLLLYLVGLGHLGFGTGTVDLVVVSDPLARLFEQRAPFQYEPVAFVALGPIEFLFAPINVIVGLVISLLVGLNLAVSWVAWRSPSACRISPGAGMIAGIPGLLSGFACCGPTLLLIIGIQASAGLITMFQWLVPVAVIMLLLTLLWVGSRVEDTPTQTVDYPNV